MQHGSSRGGVPSHRMSGSERLARVFEAWALSRACHQPEPGATARDIAAAELTLGRALPAQVREFYGFANGGRFLDGNLVLHPLLGTPADPEALSVTTASELLRSWEWPIPQPLVLLGDNGGEEPFGVWVATTPAASLVVQTGEVFEEACLVVIGFDLAGFLTAQTAFHLLSNDRVDTQPALDALGVPASLRAVDRPAGRSLRSIVARYRRSANSEPDMVAIRAWTDPQLPDADPDPYARGLTADEIDAIARSIHSSRRRKAEPS